MRFDPIDQFISDSICVSESEFALNLDYNTSDIFEEGVIDKVKEFFAFGTKRSRDLEDAINELQGTWSAEGLSTSAGWSTILKILQILLKITITTDIIGLTIGSLWTIISLAAGIFAASAGAGSLGALSIAALTSIPVYAIYGLISTMIYMLLNKFINDGLENEAVNKASTAINYLRGIRNNIAKRNPSQAKQLDADIEKIQDILRRPYPESAFEFEADGIYSSKMGADMERFINPAYTRLIRCIQNANKLLSQINGSNEEDPRLMMLAGKFLKETKATMIWLYSSFGVYFASIIFIGFGALKGWLVVGIVMMVLSLVSMLIASLVMWSRSGRFSAEIKAMATDMSDTLNSMILRTKNPTVRASLTHAMNEIDRALNQMELTYRN